MEFTGEELEELIQGLIHRVVFYEKLYANRLQIAEEKGWSKDISYSLSYISVKISNLTRLRGELARMLATKYK